MLRERLLQITGWSAFAGACALGSLFVLTRSSGRELKGWTSPEGEYHLLVVEGERDWSGFPFVVGRHHYLYVGREALASGYGHRISWDPQTQMTASDADWADYFLGCTVEWSAAGVTFEEQSGHRVFIPRRAYAGGR